MFVSEQPKERTLLSLLVLVPRGTPEEKYHSFLSFIPVTIPGRNYYIEAMVRQEGSVHPSWFDDLEGRDPIDWIARIVPVSSTRERKEIRELLGFGDDSRLLPSSREFTSMNMGPIWRSIDPNFSFTFPISETENWVTLVKSYGMKWTRHFSIGPPCRERRVTIDEGGRVTEWYLLSRSDRRRLKVYEKVYDCIDSNTEFPVEEMDIDLPISEEFFYQILVFYEQKYMELLVDCDTLNVASCHPIKFKSLCYFTLLRLMRDKGKTVHSPSSLKEASIEYMDNLVQIILDNY